MGASKMGYSKAVTNVKVYSLFCFLSYGFPTAIKERWYRVLIIVIRYQTHFYREVVQKKLETLCQDEFSTDGISQIFFQIHNLLVVKDS